MKALLVALMAFASSHTGLEEPNHLPNVEKRDPRVLARMAYPQEEKPWENHTINGLYTAGTLFLPTGWDSTSVPDNARLLHELVHHLQHMNGINLPRCAKEQQAYKVQIAYLRAAGLDPMEKLGTNAMTYIMVQMCPKWASG